MKGYGHKTGSYDRIYIQPILFYRWILAWQTNGISFHFLFILFSTLDDRLWPLDLK